MVADTVCRFGSPDLVRAISGVATPTFAFDATNVHYFGLQGQLTTPGMSKPGYASLLHTNLAQYLFCGHQLVQFLGFGDSFGHHNANAFINVHT
jgi:hypothetical protein